jgi:hypothetical protein
LPNFDVVVDDHDFGRSCHAVRIGGGGTEGYVPFVAFDPPGFVARANTRLMLDRWAFGR